MTPVNEKRPARRSPHYLTEQTEHYRVSIVGALEALEAGDTWEASAILLGALEGPAPERPYRCDACGERFAWPGLLEHHYFASHPEKPDELDADTLRRVREYGANLKETAA
jgi:hypothetical protein